MNISKEIVTSANWDAGRGGHAITGIVLHTMVGTTAGAQARFNNPASQVSVHYGVSLDGSIHQWVEEANTAYQAGNYAVNQTTIGIEHEDNGNANDSIRTDAEYEASSDLVADICRRYDIPCDTNHIFLHKDVIDKSAYPGGTACPDGLDTGRIINMASAKLGTKMEPANEGDLENIFQAVYALPVTQGDKDFWLGGGKQWTFKDLFYAVKDSKRYASEHFINDGDVTNLKAKGIDLSAAKGKMWKDGLYNGAKGISGVNKASALDYVNNHLT